MNILLTNDDGFLAPGINALKAILQKYGDVYVVAPHYWQSGKSVGISFFNNLAIHKIDDRTWSVEGTPADCVIVATLVLDIKIDLIVSGVNNGYNLSYDSMYSGTCGACYQALMYSKKAIAFSVKKFFGEEMVQINEDLENTLKYILDNDLLSDKYLLNVNFPLGDEINAINQTNVYYRKENTYYIKQSSDRFYATRDINDEECTEVGTDVYSVFHKIVSITKLKRTNEI